MEKHGLIRLILLIATIAISINIGYAETSIDMESGLTFNTMNHVRIPGNTGSDFSLVKDFHTDASPFIRVMLIQSLGKRHSLSVLFAPLTVKSEGNLDRHIDFAGVTFPAHTNLKGTYKFNSYRLTYRYEFIRTENNEFGMGLTAKIRDARIAVEGGGLSAEKSNVRFVPIVNFRYSHKISDKFAIQFQGDALAAPQGRAEDVLLAGVYSLNDNIALKAGYRILEGGSDNDVVYGFALFNYAVLGMTVKL